MGQVKDERDRKIFSLLATGEKQRVEIVDIMTEVEGVSRSSIENSLKNCMKYYDKIKKVKKETRHTIGGQTSINLQMKLYALNNLQTEVK